MSETLLSPREGVSRAQASTGSGFKAFVARMHFYIGLFVGPFILVAALTGTLYALTPQIEDWLYQDQLRTASVGEEQSLSAQVEAARAGGGADLALFAVRPAPAPGWTTRVMFSDPGLGESETRAVFVDPVTLAVTGDLVAYGTSGILPFRTTLDYLHRNLLLGEFGRAYSELAASWLWVAALGGVLLWSWRRTGRLARQKPGNANLRTRRLHGLVGVCLSVGLVFLSATGLTWSKWAGGRIDDLRNAVGWVTPSVSLSLDGAPSSTGGEHADHGAMSMPMPGMGAPALDPAMRLDAVLAASRKAGLDSPMLEIRLPRPGQAWLVREYDRSWPTQVDTIALDPETMAVTSRADFATFGTVAKLVQWGIAAHMGILFGPANQLAMAALGIGLVVTIVYGYRIWWRNRPAPGAVPRTLSDAWTRLSWPLKLAIVSVCAAFGWALPTIGFSLAAFLLIDGIRWMRARGGRRAPAG